MSGGYRGKRGKGQKRNAYNNTGGRNNNGNGNNNRPTQREHKFATLNTGNVSRFHPFETVKQKLVSNLQADKDMVDVASAIDNMAEIDFEATKPTRKVSKINVFVEDASKAKVKDPQKVDEREVEQAGFDAEWDLELKEWHEKKRKYESGFIAASAMIMNDYVTTNLHSKLTNLDTYDRDLKQNPIKLLSEINKLSQDGSTTTYKWKTVLTALIQMVTLSMDMNEHHSELKKRVSASCDVVEQLLGKHWLRGVIEKDDAYVKAASTADKDKLCEAAWNEFKAYLLLHGCLDLKFASMKQQLLSLASLNDDKHPKTLTKMNEHLATHKWDPEWSDYIKSNKERKKQQKEKRELALAQKNLHQGPRKCYCCGSPDRRADKCPKQNRCAISLNPNGGLPS